MSIRDQTSISFPSAAEVDIFLAISTPPPSPLTSYSSPLPQIPSPPLPVSSPLPMSPPPLPASPTHTIGIELAFDPGFIAMMRAAHNPTLFEHLDQRLPPLGTPHFYRYHSYFITTFVCRAGVSEVTVPPRKRLCIALDTWDEMVEDMQGTPAPTDVVELSQRMTDFVTTVRQDTDEIYRRLDDTQDDRLMETKARISREAWVQSMDASNIVRSEVRALRTTVLAQQAEIARLWTVDRTRQA
ncbi:hypothetical protein Tco_1411842 [Tanacetum coccineum]